MPKGEAPGPYYRTLNDDMIWRRLTPPLDGSRAVLQRFEAVTDADYEQIVDLLNKGTHYDGMLSALKEAQADYADAAAAARVQENAAGNYAERRRYEARRHELENTAKRLAQVIANAEPDC